ncbi:hypothetical protein [Streptomyces cinnamoneus]|uniref:Uncharacterized protein n=1 Tax=Streptomyces cinnamoneus TaxID=53446 RepID=A0A918TFJ1_STRCJ|nr:hypothetical protein [Streptomyces cinnamoneus]GHC46107.1 hypothetical protein GCM10010507_21750 [Streptomyces cinnamoneus]
MPTSSGLDRRRKRTLTSLAFVAALASGGTALGAPPAAAADAVSVDYTCTGPGAPDGAQPLQVTMTAPATVPQGGTADLTVEVSTQLTVPIGVPANGVSGEMEITLGGAGSGSVTATGFTNPGRIPSGSTVTLTGGVASVQLDAAGTATFAPGNASVHVFGVTVACTVAGTAPVAASTEVTPA